MAAEGECAAWEGRVKLAFDPLVMAEAAWPTEGSRQRNASDPPAVVSMSAKSAAV